MASLIGCLDKFTHVKIVQEFENEITHHEWGDGGINILDQSFEFPFVEPYPHCEQIISTPLGHEIQLDDVIERIVIFNLREKESPPTNKFGAS